jgi:hypothetical protein
MGGISWYVPAFYVRHVVLTPLSLSRPLAFSHPQTGGQDDLVTIYSPAEGRMVARCQGHSSFVTSIAFDRKRTNARGYRFGSVGEDGRILFWDFSAASLQRPRHGHGHGQGHAHHRLSMGSFADDPTQTRRDENGVAVSLENGAVYHPAPARSEVAMLQPVMASRSQPITFFLTALLTTPRSAYRPN